MVNGENTMIGIIKLSSANVQQFKYHGKKGERYKQQVRQFMQKRIA